MVEGSINSKKNAAVIQLANILKVCEKEIGNISQLPLIDGDEEILLALNLQNAMHPKNSNRREAVSGKTYKLI
jgi:hypothetical protein